MYKYIAEIDGMMCNMCEAHVKEIIRSTMPEAKKVKANHKKGVASFKVEILDQFELKRRLAEKGYRLIEIRESFFNTVQ